MGPALAAIRRATRQALASDARNIVELATLPSFGMRWLAPRLPQLNAAHPDIVVNLTARSNEFDFADEPFDAAIHFGRADWPNARLDLLFPEVSVPVISASHTRSMRQPSDIATMPLLTLRSRPDVWRDWFDLAGADVAVLAEAGVFDQFMMMAHAVIAGAGAALIPRFLIEQELADGLLIVPFGITHASQDAYYLVQPNGRSSNATARFADWLVSQVANT